MPMPPARHARSRRPARDSRDRILHAAAAEFAARGFSGATVDRIAARARLNKAMIYYHFRSKQALYRQLLRNLFTTVGEHMQAVVASDRTPFEKLDGFIETLVTQGMAHPDLPPIMLREIAEGGRHLDTTTLASLVSLVQAMAAIVDEGQRRLAFRRVNPLLMHLTIIWPVMVFLASAPVRAAIERLGRVDTSAVNPENFVRHLQELNRRAVALEPAAPESTSGRGAAESAR
jgi:TetR/AcrR family transcriptional regulator